jgi:dipeptidyl aminopeptidase/acylaminoacyl peptidase
MGSRSLGSTGVLALLAFGACAGADTIREVQQYSIADFYKNDDYFAAGFSPDRRRLLVSSNRSGVYNAYALPLDSGALEPLTQSTTNTIIAVSYFPHDERILYTSDQGGNELSHIYVRETGGNVRDLTPGEKHTASFAGWAHDRRSFFISTNERDQRYFDLYEIAVDGFRRRLVYRNTEGFLVGPISRDKRYVALIKVYTTSDADVFLHDLTTGATRNLTTHQGSVNNAPQDFTPDGTGLLITSDEGREFAALVRVDLANGTRTAMLAPIWDVVGAGYTHTGRYLTAWINEEAKFVTRVYDAASLREVALTGLPGGLVRGMRFSDDDSLFVFSNTDGSVPEELWVGRMGSTPRRVASGLNPAIRREDLVVPTHVRFESYDGIEIPGLLYKPYQASRRQRAPAIVMVHGGPGGQANVGYFALTQALVNHGYVVFDVNNRGSSGYGKTFFRMDDQRHGEADLGDVVASRGLLVGTGYVDSAHIGVLGGSYGGYMTLAALTLQPDAFKVGVDLFGISNWVRTLSSIPPWWEAFRRALYEELGDPATDSVRLRRISPIFNADKIRVPLMVLQGANDPRVLKVESDEIVAAARARGVPVEYVVFPDEGHGFNKKENEIQGYTAVLLFLDRYLRGSGAQP